MNDLDTIAAIATPLGTGGIGIIRLSGSLAISILKDIFSLKNGSRCADFEDRHIYYGVIADENNKVLDECMCVVMKAPRSYTKEDVAEIHCHAGSMPLKAVLGLVLNKGARLAEPGEFTKRAFLNGRIDLSQAEAVMDMINASAEKTYEASLKQLEGRLSGKIAGFKEILLDVTAQIEASIDYPEEFSEEERKAEITGTLSKVLLDIEKLADTFEYGRILSQGFKVAIAGKPNVGKSSLLNALLKHNRAIVTSIPGTTRDILEETLNIRGVPVKIIDTAGIRQTEDYVENLGIMRAKDSLKNADMVIFMVDVSEEITDEDLAVLNTIKAKEKLLVLNKTDCAEKADTSILYKSDTFVAIINASIKFNTGIEDIEDCLYRAAFHYDADYDKDLILTNARHKEALIEAAKALKDAIVSLESGMPIDLSSIDILASWQHLASITGETLGEDLIDRIFSKFCLGK